jgi:hypothetical protein
MGDTTSGVTVSHMLSQLDTKSRTSGLAAGRCVGSVPVPHAEILDLVRAPLAARNIDSQGA